MASTGNQTDSSSTVSSLNEPALSSAAFSAPSPAKTVETVTETLPAATSSEIASSATPCSVASHALKPSRAS